MRKKKRMRKLVENYTDFMRKKKHKLEDYYKAAEIYQHAIDMLEPRVTAELGDQYDVDMLSSYLFELDIDNDVAYACCLCWLGEKAFETFEYPPRRKA